MDTATEIRNLGARFEARVDSAILADALQYLDFSEWALALETLAEKLCDENISITAAECAKFNEIAAHMGMPKGELDFLRKQVSPAS